jgi:hypothetical protein
MATNGMIPHIVKKEQAGLIELRQGRVALSFAYKLAGNLWNVVSHDCLSFFSETRSEDLENYLFEAASAELGGRENGNQPI